MTALAMSAEVRNVTMVALMPAVLANNSAARFCVLPGNDGADIELAGIGLCRRDEIVERSERRSGAGDDQKVEEARRRHRGEVGENIVRQLVEQRRRDGVVVAGHEQRVAVGGGGRAGLRGDDAGGAGAILDDELLMEAARQLLAEDAHADIGDAARAIGHDQRDRMIGIVASGLRRPRCR